MDRIRNHGPESDIGISFRFGFGSKSEPIFFSEIIDNNKIINKKIYKIKKQYLSVKKISSV